MSWVKWLNDIRPKPEATLYLKVQDSDLYVNRHCYSLEFRYKDQKKCKFFQKYHNLLFLGSIFTTPSEQVAECIVGTQGNDHTQMWRGVYVKKQNPRYSNCKKQYYKHVASGKYSIIDAR